MNKTIIDNIDISGIDFDEKRGKHILDSSDKIIRWIKYKINEQEFKENESFPNYRYIDLSNCIISTDFYNGEPSLTNLCDIVEESESTELSGYFINGHHENDYHQEVQKAFICKNSIIHSAFFDRTKFHDKVDFDNLWWASILKVVQLIFASFLFIFGKIAIGYGIYQTITAFRKYGK